MLQAGLHGHVSLIRGQPFALRVGLLLGLLLASIIALLSLAPIPQSPAYHLFRDTRTCLGVPNAFNVLSNAVFTFIGALGLLHIIRDGRSRLAPELLPAYAIAFAGIFLTGFGSAYYHLAPDDQTLFWDRMPMAFAFMGLYAGVIGERISARGGALLAVPLALIGALSVLYWRWTDDLRIYGLVQFFPVVTIPLILWMFPPTYSRGRDFLIAIALYVLALVFDRLDGPVYDILGRLVSGHTIKHLLAALGSFWIYRMLRLRSPVVPPPR